VAPDEITGQSHGLNGSVFVNGHIAQGVQRGRLVDGVDGDRKSSGDDVVTDAALFDRDGNDGRAGGVEDGYESQ